jgi:hypothetical protein
MGVDAVIPGDVERREIVISVFPVVDGVVAEVQCISAFLPCVNGADISG